LIEQHSSIVDQGIQGNTFRHDKTIYLLDAFPTGYIERVRDKFAGDWCANLPLQFSDRLFSFGFVTAARMTRNRVEQVVSQSLCQRRDLLQLLGLYALTHPPAFWNELTR
jgi:hypothetical protein